MRRFLIAAVALGCGLAGLTSMARKTYTLEEIESMKKTGKLTGSERFVIIRGNDAGGINGDKTEILTIETYGVNESQMQSVEKERPVAVTDAIAYDKIGKSRYLITMAREYYGNADFWPYIYDANKTRFGHPDKITPGTTVYIPSLTKYGVDPKNQEDVEKAKKMGKEIYARYGKTL